MSVDEETLTDLIYKVVKETAGDHPVNISVALIKALKSQDIFIHYDQILPIIETDLRDIDDEFATWIVYTDRPEYEED